jgi:hypothetical protein
MIWVQANIRQVDTHNWSFWNRMSCQNLSDRRIYMYMYVGSTICIWTANSSSFVVTLKLQSQFSFRAVCRSLHSQQAEGGAGTEPTEQVAAYQQPGLDYSLQRRDTTPVYPHMIASTQHIQSEYVGTVLTMLQEVGATLLPGWVVNLAGLEPKMFGTDIQHLTFRSPHLPLQLICTQTSKIKMLERKWNWLFPPHE